MMAVETRARRQVPCEVARVSSTMPVRMVRWLPAALVAATGLLFGVLVVAMLSRGSRQVPVSGPPFVVGDLPDTVRIFGENLLVLALYASGNVAASIIRRWRKGGAGPVTMDRDLVGRLAMVTVIGLLLLATFRQVYVLGHGISGFSAYFYVSRWRVWLSVLPHALPELTGIFLPVAAWLFASRQGRQRELVAFTVIAVLGALPLLATAALTEVYVSPRVFSALTCIGGSKPLRGEGPCSSEWKECPKLSASQFEKRYRIHLSQSEIARARRNCSPPSKRQ